ncbi:NAD(P)H-quinone oxidoreductase [Corynebacterium uberis]|uniref:NAD(P)H-quinone oxidoreductase n=1 Tax=Corynebacterium TaxID=1716 RepID=UPI001D0A8C78|nr:MULTISPECIES: NAD(P)H-quinone oxidoreductase [Corynebacterium]MCZ9309887.1 NAD(P)H-quinone oxidoreductase [Corynebacterium sp. c6VSa_13]UDL73189.1 NAD(P)H-quinone oxidoreductase [Corynebacterium uberis]UDL75934.1 NAD(P)H-quinone oxidoreductase [Corynebacterium uberis]UDL78146.1 NAD(P)H-quinone oxidoreductase [Corynebacterium uberis]UDL80429.1 NAD(P)H-quinone oxidoreductase [Corynebacterium uberis]
MTTTSTPAAAATMKATDTHTLELTDVAVPQLAPGEVLVRVAAAGVNRGDVLQVAGHYPPPPGASEILGLECAGTVVDAGDTDVAVGSQVGCLLAGGGYAQFVAVPAGQLTPIPQGMSVVEAAGFVETACTVWSNLVMTARLRAGERVLIHGGAGGIGTMAIQVAKALGAKVAVTVGSQANADYCRELGADTVINYRTQDFVEELGGSCDVILDIIGAKYLDSNMRCLALDGRLVIIGLQGGRKAELNLGAMLPRRQSVLATTLRARAVEDKARIVAQTVENVWPMVAAGAVRHAVRTFPLADAAAAHAALTSGDNRGKIVLTVEQPEGQPNA